MLMKGVKDEKKIEAGLAPRQCLCSVFPALIAAPSSARSACACSACALCISWRQCLRLEESADNTAAACGGSVLRFRAARRHAICCPY
mmetsp:Transcript_26427/g.84048  ORF Transcript_26427/g.84048 Transcript_26427/m.84048 type:complete len:88 (+) Transcript_26427:1868-2131(+)